MIPDYEKPMLGLHKSVSTPVKVKSIGLLRIGGDHFVRAESTDGAVGMCKTKEIADYIPIFHRRVVPAFIGKDARDLETLIDEVYI